LSTADVRDDGSVHHFVARSFFSCTICIPPEEVMGWQDRGEVGWFALGGVSGRS
jgi:hypothetical protein